MLQAAGIEAAVTEEGTLVTVYHGGAMPGIHKPQVWVSRSDAERARQLLINYDRELVQRRRAAFQEPEPGQMIATGLCEQCGQRTPFSLMLVGSVQVCAGCGAYVDVGVENSPDDMLGEECGEGDNPASAE
jgi:hypothetical protein